MGRARFQFRAAILAAIGAGIFVPASSAQAPVTITVEMNMGGRGFSASATMPDPLAVAQKALQCGNASASCMQDVWDAAAPVLAPSPAPSGSPQPEPSGSPQPEPTPGSTQPKDDSGASSKTSAGRPTDTARERSRPLESVRPASQRELAEPAASLPLVRDRASLPTPSPPEAPLRGPDSLGLPAPSPLPDPSSGLEWSPLLLYVLLASASLALLLFLPTAAPRHGLARVSYQLAERRYDLGLIGVVMFMGLAIGYLVALWVT